MIKLRKTQAGFALIETVLILVIVALVAFVAWYAFHTKSNTDATLGTAANTTSLPSKKSSTKNNSSNATTASQVITTKSSATVGQYLADGNGKTLYTYGADTSGVSKCTGSCLTDWPVYAATSSTTNLPANVTIITRSDGGTQYAYKGQPLYHYSGDTSAGMVTGDGINDFHVAKP